MQCWKQECISRAHTCGMADDGIGVGGERAAAAAAAISANPPRRISGSQSTESLFINHSTLLVRRARVKILFLFRGALVQYRSSASSFIGPHNTFSTLCRQKPTSMWVREFEVSLKVVLEPLKENVLSLSLSLSLSLATDG